MSEEDLILALGSGCLCHIDQKLLLKSWIMPIREYLRSQDEIAYHCQRRDKLLLRLSFMNTFLVDLLNANSGPVCVQVVSLYNIIKQSKFLLMSVMFKLVLRTQDEFVKNQAILCFVTLAKNVVCLNIDCEASCRQVTQFLVRRLSRSSSNAEIMAMIKELLTETDSSSCKFKKRKCEQPLDLESASIQSSHDEKVRTLMVSSIKNEWRKLGYLHDNFMFLNIWKCLVAIRSNLGVNSCRESIASSSTLVRDVCQLDSVDLMWKTKASILNEVLCYGSTLALQSEIPDEVCSIAQAIVLETKRMNENLPVIPITSSTFFVGSMRINVEESNNPEETFGGVHDLHAVRSFSLLLLKSFATVLRQATSCSSGEDSDGSHCSRGCLCDEEALGIERNIVTCLQIWKGWLLRQTEGQEKDFAMTYIATFFDQDDQLIEGMLCLLDIFVSLNVLSSSRDVNLPHPIEFFDFLMDKCSWDSSIIIDYLLSNETNFLLYFLRLLKFIVRNNSVPISEPTAKLFKETHSSLLKLQRGNLFPYDIKPILNLLTKVIS